MHRIRITAVVAIASLLAACGGGDDDAATATSSPTTTEAAESSVSSEEATTVPATTAPATTESAATVPATTEATATTIGEEVVVGSLEEMPKECIDILTEMFKAVEPIVADMDFSTMTLSDLSDIQDQFIDQSAPYEDQLTAAGCDQYTLEGEDTDPTLTFEQLTALAEEEAPGLVGYFQFLSEQFAAVDAPVDMPEDCDSAKAAIESYIADGVNMADLPMSELVQVQGAITALYSECDMATLDEFMSRDDVTQFLSAIG